MKHYLILLICISFSTFAKDYGIGNSKKSFTAYHIENPKNATLVAVDHAQWTALLAKYVTEEGNVDYDGFKSDEAAFQDYLDILKENEPSEFWSKKETLAYWINAYNAFTVKLILDNPSVKSIKDIKDPWDKKFILIGKKWYSLGDIEHNILRKMDEPRIHFAINCASYSCPVLLNTAYVAERLEAQLKVAAYRFVNDASKNAITEDAIEISKIFEWFAEDFAEEGGVIPFLNTFSTIKIDESAVITYKDYNWSLNN